MHPWQTKNLFKLVNTYQVVALFFKSGYYMRAIKEQYRNDGLTTLCYVFHESCWINRGRLVLILIWSSPVNHFCWIIFTAQWLTGEVSFSYWFGLPLLIIWLVEDITYNTLPPPLGRNHLQSISNKVFQAYFCIKVSW